jgi:hypothetical protein
MPTTGHATTTEAAMTVAEAITQLDTIDDTDPQHEIEDIIAAFLRHHGFANVADAYEAANDRCGTWHAD